MSEHGRPEGEAVMPASGLAKAANSIEAFIKPVYTWLAYIGAAVLGALVLAMIWSIVGRRFFNAPLKGSTELTQLGAGAHNISGHRVRTHGAAREDDRGHRVQALAPRNCRPSSSPSSTCWASSSSASSVGSWWCWGTPTRTRTRRRATCPYPSIRSRTWRPSGSSP